MSENTASQAQLSPELPSVGRPGLHHRHKIGRRRESNSFSAREQGPSKLACASSRPEDSHNNAPTSASRQTHPPNAHGQPPGSLSFSRAMPSRLTPEPQRPIRHGDDNEQALWEQSSGKAMEATRFSFFDFPPEIRNMIYHCSLQRPDCAELYRSYYRQGAAQSKGLRWPRAHLRTPTILLLCKRITDESMPVLRARWFIIDRLPPCMPPLPDGKGGFLRLSNFIGRETLQRLQYIDLRIGLGEGPLGSGWIWNRVLDELLAILNERNSLVHFRLLIRRCNQAGNPSIRSMEITEEGNITKKIMSFQMSNPNIFRPCKITVETWAIDGQQATFLACHHKPERFRCNKHPELLCRSYPDPELFPGSIMQFVHALPEGDWSDEED